MKNATFFLQKTLVLLAACSFYSCSPIYYAPNAHNVPLLREKHEVRINTLFSGTEYLTGGEVQASYAVTDHIGVLTNWTYLQSSKTEYGNLFESGAGYFKAFPKGLNLEVYGGLGRANVRNEYHTAPFTKAFIQPAIGFRTQKPFFWPFFKKPKQEIEIALSPKVAYIYYSEPFLHMKYTQDGNGNLVETIGRRQHGFWAFEPALTVRSGWKYILLQCQVGYSFQEIPDSEKINFNVGLSFNVAPRFKSQRKNRLQEAEKPPVLN